MRYCPGKNQGLIKCQSRVQRTLTHNFAFSLDVPRFIIAPPSIMTLRVDDDVTLDCQATSKSPVTLSWEREGSPLPKDRTVVQTGKLTIRRIQKNDYGVYTCIASSNDGKARHSTTLAVICE